MKKFAWWSTKSYHENGYCVYLTPDDNEVMVCTISDSDVDPPGLWDDYVLIGEVKSFLRSYWKNQSFDDFMAHKDDWGKELFKIKSIIN